MNPGQEMFHHFFMERTIEAHQQEAKALLEECFEKQDNGTFDLKYLEQVMPSFFAMVKPEATEELKEAMAHFASRL